MTGFFLALCTLLSRILNPVILLLMIFELGLGVIVGWQLVRLKNEINRLNASGRRKNKLTLRKGRGHLTTTFESISEKDWNDFDAFLGQYQRDLVTCNFFSLLIQIFPLLGILGTVAGLYISVNSGQDIYEGVKFALSSTVYGIIAAVIFKIVDIIFTARFLNYIDDGIDRFEKNYSIVSQEAMAERESANASPQGPLSRDRASVRTGTIAGWEPYPRTEAGRSAGTEGGRETAAESGRQAAAESGRQAAAESGRQAAAESGRQVPAEHGRPLSARSGRPSSVPSLPEEDFNGFPEPESLRRGQDEAKNVADMIKGWRKGSPAVKEEPQETEPMEND